MLDELLKGALSQGFGYALFVFLFIYVLKKQDERDKKAETRELNYQNLLDKVTNSLKIVEIIESDVKEIKQKL